MDSTDQACWSEKENNNEESTFCRDTGIDIDLNMNNTLLSKIPSYNIRKMDSSDRNQWLQETELAVNNEGLLSGMGNISCSESSKSNSSSNKSHSYGIRKMDSSDRNRWLQEAVQDDIINEKPKSCTSSSSSESNKSNTLSNISSTYEVKRMGLFNGNQCLQNSDKQELNIHSSKLYADSVSNLNLHTNNSIPTKNEKYCVRKMDSFDTPWWLNEEKSDDSKQSSNKAEVTKSDNSSIKSPEMTVSYGVRRMDSFDSPWWLSGDEAKQVNSLNDNSIKNQCIKENSSESFPIISENDEHNNLHKNEWWLNKSIESQLETDLPKFNGDSNIDEMENNLENYLDSKELENWNNDYPSIKKMDSSESQWWEQDKKKSDARSTSISIDWSGDGPELPDHLKNTSIDSHLKTIAGVRKMDSYDSPSWLASEESESQSHEPKQTSSGDAISSSSKHELVDSSPDWWGEKNESDDFVRTKRTSLRIKNIENVVNDFIDESINNIPKEPNLQDELDQLMLFIGGCRNIDELLGNEEPPPAAPTTPPDTDSGNILSYYLTLVHRSNNVFFKYIR